MFDINKLDSGQKVIKNNNPLRQLRQGVHQNNPKSSSIQHTKKNLRPIRIIWMWITKTHHARVGDSPRNFV